MGDTFVDLTYRGLALGRRVKLAQVRPTTAYLELPAPMPVGTTIGILTDDTVALDAQVVAVHEQIGGSDQPPGMLVKPRLSGDAAEQWWNARVTLPDPSEAVPVPVPLAPVLPPAAIVLPKRRTLEGAAVPGVPELVDDGIKTSVMQAVEPEEASIPIVQDDGRATTAMSAVDLEALGLDPNAASTSGQMPAVSGDDDPGNGNGDTPDGKAKKKRRRR